MRKGNNLSSDHDQTQLTQAQTSIQHLQNALSQAESHPTSEIIGQITEAMERAEKSLAQAEKVEENEGALELARRELQESRETFDALNQNM
ncbi:hypothetical protein NC661_11685 [Aquibacillus koreensis]|uniref:Uncharacterized protein n=1 Tax=Aquibacillus koreensis TaxID=279446 RepID=A0A9X3WJ76_9BACI|nr:hypothetical protein [Aquibacillus koreensis]MCT2535173.1 hypothetical protein [Aquibacillus koreensis]MDC3421032.1 hypothetical protein [Aquibacillus koreensis]